MLTPPRTVVRREGGLYALERALRRRGFRTVAGADEAGRGACAGPLVAAAVLLPDGRRGEVDGLADSKLLTPAARERVYDQVVSRALAYSVVVIPPADVDNRGLHVCNVAAMRRALATLAVRPEYVLTDGFPVDGLGVPGLAVWKGDRVAACVAAASVLAKVTRDRIMAELDQEFPSYGFAEHKGYVTPEHTLALDRHGPCVQHRFSYVNVAAALAGRGRPPDRVARRLAAGSTVGTAGDLTGELSGDAGGPDWRLGGDAGEPDWLRGDAGEPASLDLPVGETGLGPALAQAEQRATEDGAR
jgi:ribonuclease HII